MLRKRWNTVKDEVCVNAAGPGPRNPGRTRRVNIVFSPQAWEDYQYWQTVDRAVLKRINKLIADTCRSPQEGIGKPEPLKYGLAGAWPRRVTLEHRLVYRAVGADLQILQARYHYL